MNKTSIKIDLETKFLNKNTNQINHSNFQFTSSFNCQIHPLYLLNRLKLDLKI